MSTLIMAEQAAKPSTPAAGKVKLYVDNSNPARYYMMQDDGLLYPVSMLQAASTAAVSNGYASDTYLAGSGITIPAGEWKVGTTYYCMFDMVKTNAGTNAFTVIVRMGTLGTTGDSAILTLAFAVGTAAVDTGIFELWVTFRSIGAGTSAVIQGVLKCQHHLAATGLITTGASGTGIVLGTSSGFASTTPTKIGISVNGGGSFLGTNTLVQSSLQL